MFSWHPSSPSILAASEEQPAGVAGHKTLPRSGIGAGDHRLSRFDCGKDLNQWQGQNCISLELYLQNRFEEMARIAPALAAFGQQERLQTKVIQAADLALEEHVTNVIRYAFDAETSHTIVVRVTMSNGALQMEVEDDGRSHNPLTFPPVDTTIPLEEKPIGGLGIHLIRTCMDEVDYRREGGKNILRLRKQIVRTPVEGKARVV